MPELFWCSVLSALRELSHWILTRSVCGTVSARFTEVLRGAQGPFSHQAQESSTLNHAVLPTMQLALLTGTAAELTKAPAAAEAAAWHQSEHRGPLPA